MHSFSRSCLLLTSSLLYIRTNCQQNSQYVDPFFGSSGEGHMFPGVVSAPFATIKLGPDVYSGKTDAYAGYLDSGNITAFSLMHQSGIGGAPKYGVVAQQPVVGKVYSPLEVFSCSRSKPDQAEVGRYRSFLSNGISVEMAATEHAGMFSYQFPEDSQANVVVNLSHYLSSSRGLGTEQHYVNGSITIQHDDHHRPSYTGSVSYNNGWNLAPDWIIYFCGHFDSPSTNNFSSASGQGPHDFNNRTVGVTFSFADGNVTSRVGVSWISIAKACQFVDDEIPTDSTIDDLAAAAKDNWNTQIFSNIKAETKDSETLGLFYSSLYGMNLMPSNRTGENPLWESSEPYYDDIVTLWDLFRSAPPLIQILQPVAYEEQIRSMIDIWRHDGYMPDGRSSNFNGRTQGGSNADNVLADAYVKGVVGGIDWSDGYRAMVKDAEVPPPNNHVDPAAPDSSDKEGRGALPDWLALHYVSTKYSRSVTRAVEYSANDFALFQVAKGMDKTEDAAKYLNRSRNWRNHWDPNATALGFSGFVVPRHEDGSFVNQDPLSCGGCYWPNAYYEALPWEYTFNPIHDMATLIYYMGGTELFINRLNVTFEPNKGPKGRTVAFGNTIFDPTNEVSFLTPYLYHYAGRQDLSVKTARNLAEKNFKPGKSGLPGNSDSGAMQSWLLWNMVGIYPVTGQTTFLIGSPWFGMTIDLGEGKTLKITTNQGGNDTAIYVQSLRVNGRKWNKNWLQWSDVFANGGTLDFDLAEAPSGWSLDGELPPSPASERQSL